MAHGRTVTLRAVTTREEQIRAAWALAAAARLTLGQALAVDNRHARRAEASIARRAKRHDSRRRYRAWHAGMAGPRGWEGARIS